MVTEINPNHILVLQKIECIKYYLFIKYKMFSYELDIYTFSLIHNIANKKSYSAIPIALELQTYFLFHYYNNYIEDFSIIFIHIFVINVIIIYV